MKDNAYRFLATLALALGFSVSVAQAAPRSTPVTVVNDSATPVPVEAKSYRYVGNSSAKTLPYIGINGMHATCQADFGAAAKMCTTKEVFETTNNIPSYPPGTEAWVQPVITSAFTFTEPDGTTIFVYMDVGGAALPSFGRSGANCSSWLSNSHNTAGAVAAFTSNPNAVGNMGIAARPCDWQPLLSVTCCLPQ